MSAPIRAAAGGPKLKPLQVEVLNSFKREAKKVLSPSSYKDLLKQAAQFRELAPIITGTGGLRKLRWALDGNKGKSSGTRVLYYYGGDHMPIYLIAFYPKSAKSNISGAEKKAIKKFIVAINAEYDPKRKAPKLKVVK